MSIHVIDVFYNLTSLRVGFLIKLFQWSFFLSTKKLIYKLQKELSLAIGTFQ